MRSFAQVIILTLFLVMVPIFTSVNAACTGSTDEFKPFYNCGTHTMILKFKVEDSDCFKEIYARATPQGENNVLLNKQSYRNNDAPDAGPTDDKGKFTWRFEGIKVANSDSKTIRAYMTLILVDGSNGQTVTKYYHNFDIRQTVWDFTPKLGYFHLHAHPDACLS